MSATSRRTRRRLNPSPNFWCSRPSNFVKPLEMLRNPRWFDLGVVVLLPVRHSRKTGATVMIKIALRFTVLAFMLACSLPAHAAGPYVETWVSHTGIDTNNCNTPSSPCRTLTGALSQTLAGGQINVMDSGDFSPVNITQSV